MAWTKEGKMKERTKKQKAYLEYYEKKRKAGGEPMTLYRWKRIKGKKDILRPGGRTRTTIKRLKEAGLTESEIKRITG